MVDYITLLLEEVRKAKKEGEVPVACLIEKGGKVIALRHNEVERRKDPTAHAELLAIRDALKVLKTKYLRGCTLYVSLEPCPMCAFAMVLVRLDKVVFFAQERRGGAMSLYSLFEDERLNHRVIWEYRREESFLKELKEFFKGLRP